MASAEPVSIGDLLKRYRVNAGLTQEALAERAGLSARAIRALETGARRAPRKETLALLASALGLSAAERGRIESELRQRRVSVQSPPVVSATAAYTVAYPPRMPLVGRQRERALLDSHLSGDAPPLLLLAGEPGIGKSRLLEEAVERAEALGLTVLAGGCHRRSAQEPYEPCVDALARFIAARPPAQSRLDLHGCAWLVRLLPELAQHTLAPALSWTLPPRQERRLMFAAVARYLANIAHDAGALLILDDLHWAGTDALDLLAFLLRESPGRNVRVIGAYRDTDVTARDPLPMLLGDLERDGLAARVPLAPLAPEEAAQLLQNLLADVPVDTSDVRRAIVSRAGGIPFHLVSCTQEARNSATAHQAAPVTVPRRAADSIRQRVSLLAEPAWELLAVAAIAERQIPRAILLRVAEGLGYAEDVTLLALEAALRARLLTEHADGGYAFTHDLIRETVEADLSGARRAFLHRRVAEALERLPQPELRAAELAGHFARGDEPARALPYALRAGDDAEAVYAHSEAEYHYRMAAEWAQQIGDQARVGEALEKRADVLFRLARFTDAYTCLEHAIRLYHAAGNWERLAWSTAQIARAGEPLGRTVQSLVRLEELFTTLAMVALGRHEGGEPTTGTPSTLERRAEQAASLVTPRTAARVYLCLTTRLLFLERYDEVYGPSERTVQHARAAGDLRIESLAHGFRADAQQAQGRLAEAAASVTLARERAVASGDLEALYIALNVEANIGEVRAEPLHARDTYLSMLEVAMQLGDVSYVIEVRSALALNAFALGEWDQAESYLAQSVALLPGNESDRLRSPGAGLALLGALRAGHDPTPSAALAGTEDAADDRVRMWAVSTLSELDVLAGRPDDAAARLHRTFARTRGRRSAHAVPFRASYCYALLAWAELERGNQERSREALTRARQLAADQHSRMALADVERVAALLALRAGRWEEARQSLEQSLAICQEAPYPYAEAKTRYIYGQLHSAAGSQADAHHHYTLALAICERLGERRYRFHIERALGMLPEDAGPSPAP